MILKNNISRYYFLFLVLVFLILICGTGSYGLAETSEARYAEISREMLLSGDYINPKLHGIFHYHKPPVTYYITTLGYRLFGINEFGARFFLQIAIIIQLLLIYKITCVLYNNKKIAFLAGLIYFSMPIVLISSRNLTTDAFLTTFIMGAIYYWLLYDTKGKHRFLYLFYSLVGLALLIKGPVALLFILVYIITSKIIFRKSIQVTVHHILGFLLCFIIGASWYMLMIIEKPELWNYFLKEQLVSRMTSQSFNRGQPFWFYFPILIGLLFPWWIVIVSDFKYMVKSRFYQRNQTLRLIIISCILTLVFSLFKTKLILYLLPMFWIVAIVLADKVIKLRTRLVTLLNLSYAFLVFVLFLGAVIFWYVQRDFIQINLQILFIPFITLLLFFLISFSVEDNIKLKPGILAAIFASGLLLTANSVMSVNENLINSVKKIVQYIDYVHVETDKTIVVYDYLLNAIPFYTDDTLITLANGHNTTEREVQFQNDKQWKNNLWDIRDATIIKRLDSLSKKQSTYFLYRKNKMLSKNLQFIERNFTSKKDFAKWVVYYNK